METNDYKNTTLGMALDAVLGNDGIIPLWKRELLARIANRNYYICMCRGNGHSTIALYKKYLQELLNDLETKKQIDSSFGLLEEELQACLKKIKEIKRRNR